MTMHTEAATTDAAITNAELPVVELPKRRERLKADLLVAIALVGDIVMIFLGKLLGFWLKFQTGLFTTAGDTHTRNLSDYTGLMVVGLVVKVVTFALLGLYKPDNLLRLRQVIVIVVKGGIFWLFAFLGILWALKLQPTISRLYVIFAFLAVLGLLFAWRWAFDRFLHLESIACYLRRRILFAGWNPEAERLTMMLQTDRRHPYDIVGCIAPRKGEFQNPPPPSVACLGHYDNLESLLRAGRADIVILAGLEDMNEIVTLSNLCEKQFVQFKVIPSYFQILVSGLRLDTISGVPLLGVSQLPLDRIINRILKRFVDVLGAIVGLIIAVPVLVVCGLLILWEQRGPVFFVQERIGRNGRRFNMYKLRSMRLGSDATDHLNQSTLRNDPRLLRFGAFMRRWNLDEFPQFWNVLKGDMSLVGPRPERTFHSEKLSDQIPHYNARYSSKPGITGWAQVNGLRGGHQPRRPHSLRPVLSGKLDTLAGLPDHDPDFF